MDSRLSIWDLRTGRERLNVPLDSGFAVTHVSYSPDGTQLGLFQRHGRTVFDGRPLEKHAVTSPRR